MGRIGKKPSMLEGLIRVVNANVGKTLSSTELFLGRDPGPNRITMYVYQIAKLGYVKPLDGGFIKRKETRYKVLKAFPPYYNSTMLEDEIRAYDGYIPETHKRITY